MFRVNKNKLFNFKLYFPLVVIIVSVVVAVDENDEILFV